MVAARVQADDGRRREAAEAVGLEPFAPERLARGRCRGRGRSESCRADQQMPRRTAQASAPQRRSRLLARDRRASRDGRCQARHPAARECARVCRRRNSSMRTDLPGIADSRRGSYGLVAAGGVGRGGADDDRARTTAQRGRRWRLWGPYVSERAWGTVREDYSADGAAWEYFPHDTARSRAYRWSEDGLAGICDDQQRLCFALALWNGQRPDPEGAAVRPDRAPRATTARTSRSTTSTSTPRRPTRT